MSIKFTLSRYDVVSDLDVSIRTNYNRYFRELNLSTTFFEFCLNPAIETYSKNRVYRVSYDHYGNDAVEITESTHVATLNIYLYDTTDTDIKFDTEGLTISPIELTLVQDSPDYQSEISKISILHDITIVHIDDRIHYCVIDLKFHSGDELLEILPLTQLKRYVSEDRITSMRLSNLNIDEIVKNLSEATDNTDLVIRDYIKFIQTKFDISEPRAVAYVESWLSMKDQNIDYDLSLEDLHSCLAYQASQCGLYTPIDFEIA